MFNRRTFIATAAAAFGTPALAQDQNTYVVPEDYMPAMVRLQANLAPGQIHVDPNSFRLYLTLPDRMAIRYTVGVGRENLYEHGEFFVGAKKEWPSWTPTPDMIKRDPDHYARYADGMPGGPDNPLGSRALYLFYPGAGDSFLRIHGTPQPWTIASAVSNGCARLVNSHIMDLYDRVELGAPVFLYPRNPALPEAA